MTSSHDDKQERRLAIPTTTTTTTSSFFYSSSSIENRLRRGGGEPTNLLLIPVGTASRTTRTTTPIIDNNRIPWFYLCHRSFHTSRSTSTGSSHRMTSSSIREFDPLRYPFSVALLKSSSKKKGRSTITTDPRREHDDDDDNPSLPSLSPEEEHLKECLHDYQEEPNDLNVLDALQQAYSTLEFWEEALAVEVSKCDRIRWMWSEEDRRRRHRHHHPSDDDDNDHDESENSYEYQHSYADSIHVQGKLWLRQGNFEQSRPLYEEALSYFRKKEFQNPVQEGHVLISLAGWHFFQYEASIPSDRSTTSTTSSSSTSYAVSSQSLQKAMEYLIESEGKLDSNPTLLVKCLDNQGLIYRLWGDYEMALDKYQQALQVVIDQKTKHALQLHIADMYQALREPHEALILYQNVLHDLQEEDEEGQSTMMMSDSTRTTMTTSSDSLAMQGVLWHNIASIHVQMGEWEIAEEGFLEAIKMKEESAGREDHPELVKTWNALGALYYGFMFDEKKLQALECFKKVLWMTRAHSVYDDPRYDPDVLAAIQTISDIEEQIELEKRQGTSTTTTTRR